MQWLISFPDKSTQKAKIGILVRINSWIYTGWTDTDCPSLNSSQGTYVLVSMAYWQVFHRYRSMEPCQCHHRSPNSCDSVLYFLSCAIFLAKHVLAYQRKPRYLLKYKILQSKNENLEAHTRFFRCVVSKHFEDTRYRFSHFLMLLMDTL